MTPDERLERIAELQREADEGRARIAERIARRDRDPGGELERLMADQRFTHDQSDLIYTSPVEPVGSPPARKNDEPHIIYRRYDGAQPERFPGSGAEPSGDDPSFEEAVDNPQRVKPGSPSSTTSSPRAIAGSPSLSAQTSSSKRSSTRCSRYLEPAARKNFGRRDMWNGRRRVDIRAWHSVREEHAATVAERDMLRAENDTLKRQWDSLLRKLAGVTEELRALRAAVRVRQKAQAELDSLYRERDIERARAAERDPNAALN